MTVCTTLLSKGQREFHISALGSTSHPFLLSKKPNRKVNKRLKAGLSVGWVECRVVCQSVGLAIKTPHTPEEERPDLLEEPGSFLLLWVLFIFLKMLSPSLEKEEEIIYNLLQLIQRIQNIKMVSLPGAAPNIGGQY